MQRRVYNMATKIVSVNSLTVAKRWLKQMKETYHPNHHKRLGIWEKPRQYVGVKSYAYNDSMIYIVGHSKSVELKISNLGKRIDHEM